MAEPKTPATNKKSDKAAPATITPGKKSVLQSDEPRNFLATFLLTTIAAPLGLRHFYLGDSRFGWIRSALFVGGIVVMIIFGSVGVLPLIILGWLAMITAIIWGIVDFFYVYFNVRHDVYGRPLVATVLDRKFATVIFWVAIALAAAALIASLIGISIGQSSLDSWPNGNSQWQPNSNWQSGGSNNQYY